MQAPTGACILQPLSFSPPSDGTNLGCQLRQFSGFQGIEIQQWVSGDGSLTVKAQMYLYSQQRLEHSGTLYSIRSCCSGVGRKARCDAMLGSGHTEGAVSLGMHYTARHNEEASLRNARSVRLHVPYDGVVVMSLKHSANFHL